MNYELRIDRRMCFPTRDARPTACWANSLFSPGQHPGGNLCEETLGRDGRKTFCIKKSKKNWWDEIIFLNLHPLLVECLKIYLLIT